MTSLGIDLLEKAQWECVVTTPGQAEDPDGLAALPATWFSASVPGTVAGALSAATTPRSTDRNYDDEEYWFRCKFTGGAGVWKLTLNGLATIADVWLNGRHLARSENMFRKVECEVGSLEDANVIAIRFSPLSPLLESRRPRPRWKTYMVKNQNLRWVRTSLLGRIPGWAVTPPVVGPWRPITLTRVDPFEPSHVRLRTSCDGDDGIVRATLRFAGGQEGPKTVRLIVGDSVELLELSEEGDALVADGTVRIKGVERWWPHTHGSQPLYQVQVEADLKRKSLGKVGFRTISVETEDSAFRVIVNGEPIFCRGACWTPPDPTGLSSSSELLVKRLELVRDANMNMLRVPGTTVYEDHRFFELCDELGILVWHDCMFAFMDPPDDEDFERTFTSEVTEFLDEAGSHASLAVVCGNQEVEEIASMNGLPPDRWRSPLFEKTIPSIVAAQAPGAVYVASNPTGGHLPFQMDSGVSQYFGVGGYLRSPDDARRAGVRFAAECLALSNPPEPRSIEEELGGPNLAGHDPEWKKGVHHDAGRSWDMEDVRDFYVRSLFDVDPLRERYIDPERALDLGRATNAELMGRVFSEWRRPGSTCAGGLVLSFQDLRAGAGWGVIDFLGRPKSPWFALRRAFQPVALLLTDEGLNGIRLHLVNDSPDNFAGTLRVDLYARGELHLERGESEIAIPARNALVVDAGSLLEGFRDVSYAYRFTPPAHDILRATLVSVSGEVISDEVFLPTGQNRALEHDVGLEATLFPADAGSWSLKITTRRFAQWVSIDAPGYLPQDSWFHLAPGADRTIELRPDGEQERPSGFVRALNSQSRAPLR